MFICPHSPLNVPVNEAPPVLAFKPHHSLVITTLRSPLPPSPSLPFSLWQAAAAAQAGGSFWLRARMNTKQFHGKSLDPSALAIVQYDSAGLKGHLGLKQLPDSKIWPLMKDKVGERHSDLEVRGRLLHCCIAPCGVLMCAYILTFASRLCASVAVRPLSRVLQAWLLTGPPMHACMRGL